MNKHPSAPDGFSLVEIIAAIMILSFGLLTMAASTTYVTAQLRSASFDTQRNLARQQVMEQLRGTFYDSVNTNTTGLAVGRYRVTWNVTIPSANNPIKEVRVITRGPAYRPTRTNKAVRSTVTDTAFVEIVRPS